MAKHRSTTTRSRTIGQMLREARLDKGKNGKPMPKTKAVEELGLGGRQTYYHWEDDYVTPSLEHAPAIAEFCDVPVEEIVNEILKAKGLRTYDEYLRMKSSNASARLRARSTGTIPGLCSWGGRGGRVVVPVRLDNETRVRVLPPHRAIVHAVTKVPLS